MPDFTLPFPPVGANNSRKFRQQHYSAAVREIFPDPRPLATDCILHAVFNPPATAGFVRYDLDNLLKPTQDALKGIAYFDDNQVRCLHVRFGNRSGNGSVLVRIEPMIRHESTVNFSKGKTR